MDNGADLGAKNNVSPYALPPYSHPACCWDVFFVDVFGVCVAAGGTCCSLVCVRELCHENARFWVCRGIFGI